VPINFTGSKGPHINAQEQVDTSFVFGEVGKKQPVVPTQSFNREFPAQVTSPGAGSNML